MSDDLDLARRAVACKGWRWMPGMLTLPFHENDDRCAPVCHPPWRVTRDGVAGPWAHDATWGALPDLSDPATLGCLLYLVREAWKSPLAQVSPSLPDGHMWICYINDEAEDRLFREKTEAEALVAALEAAP
jgi:hypothetical protein